MELIAKSTGYFKSFDGTQIYYESRGTGEPIILVYGIACLINHWHHQIEYFAKNYQVIAFDLRGHHKSAMIEGYDHLSLEATCKDILLLMEHLNISKAHFLGHSFGAPLILQAYDMKPEAFLSMGFINGFSKNPIKGMFGLDVIEPFFYFVKSQYEQHPDLWRSLWKTAVDNPLAMVLAGLAGGFNLHLTHFKDIEVYARGVARMDLEVFLVMFEELMKFDGDNILPKIAVPALVISGEKDNVTPQKFQHEFRDKIPHSEFVSVPYGSHCTQLDFPDYINLKIEDFLRKSKSEA